MLQLRKLSLVGLLTFATSAPAHAADLSQWRANLYGVSTDDSLSSSRVVGVDARVEFSRHFGDSVRMHFLGGALLETGSSSSLFTDEFEPQSRIFLKDARISWDVFSALSLEAGAIRQEAQKSPPLLANSTFPAALALVHLGSGAILANLEAEAAVPISQRLSTKSAGKEATPLLYAQTATLGWKKDPARFALARVTHFQFSNMTHGMAQDSRFYGNTVSGIAGASTFYYAYQGFELGGDASLPVSKSFDALAGVSHVQNQQGPPGQNTGIYGYAGFQLKTSSVDLRPQVEWYQNQADSSPAFYSSSKFGHNNRQGPGGQLNIGLKKTGLEIELTARSTRLINPQPFQKDKFQYYELQVGIPYANF